MPESNDIASWLKQLHAAKLIRLDVRLGLQVERLLRLPKRWDPEELGHCLASLLACDRKAWEAIHEHYRVHFGICEKADGRPPETGNDQTNLGDIPVVPGVMVRSPEVKQRPHLPWLALAVGALVVGLILARSTCTSIEDGVTTTFTSDNSTGSTGDDTTTVGPESTTDLATTDSDTETTGAPDWDIEQTEPAVRTTVQTRRTEVPVAYTSGDVPVWVWLMLGPGLFLGYLAVRWWYAPVAVKQAFEELGQRAEDKRQDLLEEGVVVGLEYRVECRPPLPVHALEDAATELGRAGRVCASRVLDVPPTIARTIDLGGQLAPVFELSSRGVVPVVLVDTEDNGHPYLFGVEEILAYWRQGGVAVERFEFVHRPSRIRSEPTGPWIRLEELADRMSERPLLLFSRMRLPLSHGRLDWPVVLAHWSQRVWIDLDPRPLKERQAHEHTLIRKLAARGLPRFELTCAGIVAACRALAYPGQVFPVPASKPLERWEQSPQMQQALELWAACGSCVPDATWAQLESLRCAFVELHEHLPEPRYVQRLVEWMHTKPKDWREVADAGMDEGPKFWPAQTARVELLAKLRAYDDANGAGEERLEERARKLLIGQLEGAVSQFDDAFTKEMRAHKIALHKAIMRRDEADELLARFGASPVARETRDAIREEMAVQQKRGERRWSLALGAWQSGGEAVRRRDYWRILDNWRPFIGRGVLLGSCIIMSWVLWLGGEFGWVGEAPVQVSEAPSVVVTPGGFRVAQKQVPMPRVISEKSSTPPPPGEQDAERYGHLRPALVETPAGSFWMGSPKDEKYRSDDETRHRAEVRALLVCQTEVTVAQWKAVEGSKPEGCTSEYGCDDNHPINAVSWNDACRYMHALTGKENSLRQANGESSLTQCYEQKGDSWGWKDKSCTGYRLPTEAEWEYVARGGTETAYSFGNDTSKICEYANIFTCHESLGLLEVAKLKSNPWGLYDVHGNVWEWVWDGYASYPEKPSKTYAGSDSAGARVLRGGSFLNGPGWLRSALRSGYTPTYTFPDEGFRCVRLAPQD